jgi:hypothetical protein
MVENKSRETDRQTAKQKKKNIHYQKGWHPDRSSSPWESSRISSWLGQQRSCTKLRSYHFRPVRKERNTTALCSCSSLACDRSPSSSFFFRRFSSSSTLGFLPCTPHLPHHLAPHTQSNLLRPCRLATRWQTLLCLRSPQPEAERKKKENRTQVQDLKDT